MASFRLLILFFLLGSLYSCNNYSDLEWFTSSSENSEDEDASAEEDGCRFEDGTHAATVNYYNPKTGYSQTYALDVEVESCEVVQINFPNGGWLDSDHITPEELKKDGSCTIEGEDGKTYEVQIDD